MLRDVVVCERRAWHDVHTDPGLRDAVASFVQLLWAEGLSHERDVLSALEGARDLRGERPGDRRRLTMLALADLDAMHVLGGEIVHGDLVGRPDLISRIDGEWVAGDVKAGSPFMPDGRRVKREYGVQIGLYARLIQLVGVGSGDTAFVVGADGERAMFDIGAPWGVATVRTLVDDAVGLARAINAGAVATRGEAAARCGLCHWRSLCRRELEAADDVTLVAEVGRRARSQLEGVARNRAELADLDLATASVRGVGADRLARFQARARLQLTPGAVAYARAPLGLVRPRLEWHLDIEADPTRNGLVYLHGVWERRLSEGGGETTRFVHFFADGDEGERDAFAAAWAFLGSDRDARVFYYSRYERTSYRLLQRRHPGVCGANDIEAFFSDPRVVDLYTDVVRPLTEWPLNSYGIKPIAKSLGFAWAAEDASGASSIAWYDGYVRGGDAALRDKIIDYNRSDCIASAVVLDALLTLPVGAPAWRSPIRTASAAAAPARPASRMVGPGAGGGHAGAGAAN